MASNFDFIEKIDRELFLIIEEAQKLFRDEYFNQAMVQIRIFAEKMSKKILNSPENLTFDDTVNCLKDKIKTDREKEFVEDLFFIKKQGNKCAHGEDTSASEVLEAIRRAFEISINYANEKENTSRFDKLNFDETLLITTKPIKHNKIVEKYIELAQKQKEELLNLKQSEFIDSVEKKDTQATKIKNKKPLSPEKLRIKEKIKQGKKNLKQNINKITKPKISKISKKSRKKNKIKIYKLILFILFTIISLFFLTKMIFFF